MRKLKLFTFLLALLASVGMSWAIPTEFAYCYDCQRSPAYPKTNGSCTLSGFSNPYVGNRNPSGPWKVEFVEYYNASSSLYDFNVSYIASTYGIAENKVEVYRLYQKQNGTYQPVAYGVLCAYANESNPVEHAAFFEANGHYGCYLTGEVHSGGSVSITFNEDAKTGFADLQPAPMTYKTGSWTHVGYNTGRTNTPNATSGAISYKGFNGNVGGWGSISYIEDPNRGIGYQAAGNGKNSERKGLYSIYKNEQTIPSYSKRRMTGTFTLNSSDAKYKSTAALYAHNNQSELEYYSVDFTHGLKDGTGSSKRINYVVNETKNGSWQSNSANYTYDFDNSTGSAEATKGWYILLAHTIVTDAVYSSGVAEKASFKSTSENYTWYYYKYVTFDPNGGTGDMAVQTVENSAQLHHNAFSRTGYSFAGWNTQPDGNGTAYANEAVVTATENNKGPVTLYAQWTVHQYTISFDSNGGTPVASITQNYGTAVSEPADPTRDGYTFAGWDADIPTTMPAHDVHLVAHWNAINPTPTSIATEFAYCYDCQRYPPYPTISGQCHLSGFDWPMVGNGSSAGPWKVEFVEYYNSSSSLYDFDVSSPAYVYGIDESQVEIYRLYQWNESAGEYKHAAYGVLCAYANENNTAEHAALFVAEAHWGCYLTGTKHTGSDDVYITFDEDAKTGFSDLQNVTPAEPTMLDILAELHSALGNQVWTGYGAETGVISYSRGDDAEEFRASFMGGTYTILLEFSDFISAEKVANGDGSHTYTLEVNLPAQITGLATEILHVTVNSNGEIIGMTSVHAGAEMTKESNSAITSWAELQAAMTAGGLIKLTQDITAESTDAALEVPADKTVLLELNGHIIDRALTSAVANGSVIINNGVLAVMDETGNGKIKGGNTTGKGGGVYNNGTFTLYSGEITGNHADEMGGGVYNHISNSDTEGFWMTGGLIDGNTAGSYPAIEGEVAFNNLAVVQINSTGTTVSVTTAKAHLDVYNYIKPVMPDMSMYAILAELYAALGDDVWTGYGANTGVISYSRGDEANEFRASFMGGTYTIDIPFGDFTAASKHEDGGNYIYDLTVNLPAQTGMSQETLHVTVNSNGQIEAMESENAGIELQKETDNEITTWAQLQAAMNAGGMIKLTHDITAESTDAALEVPANTTVMLDLNGHTLDRALTSTVANGSVIVNNGVLAIMDEAGNGKIKGGNTTGNGGGVLNNGIFTLYAGEITGNHADGNGGGVYNNGGEQGFWMTGGLIDNNTATTNPAISGNVIFNNLAVVQVDANGTTVSPATAVAGLSHYSYIKPVMPDMEMYAILAELYAALGNDVWTGYGTHTGVISYSRGDEANEFRASFMGGTYTIDIPFGDFTSASKSATAEGGAVYTLVVSLPAQTGMSQETLQVTVNSNGEIEAIHSDIAEIDLNKETDNEITTWAQLQAAMTAGGMIKLTHDITAESTDAALEVPMNTTVMLDLNGHTIDRALASATANGNVIVNNGVLAIMDEAGNGKIKGGNNSGNGGGVLNNGTLTLYGGEITGNHAAQGAGVYNNVANDGLVGFWMTGGLIDGNEAASYPAIKGDVIFSNLAVVQINAGGNTVSAATAIAGLATYDYIQPVMPNMDMFAILAELHAALGTDVWAGYGEQTGVITYAQGTEPNSFEATFMGGAYSIDIPFGDFTQATKNDNGDGTYTYVLDVNLPAQTGMDHEVLHVTTNANGEITGIHSDNAQTDMNKVGGALDSWAALQAAMANGGVLQLSHSLIDTNQEGALVVPAGRTVVLDLNGFTLNRHLTSAQENGSVIINNGTLAIMDNAGGGEIHGGNNSGNGGGIVNNGTFTLYGGKIRGNCAAQGAGVYNSVANNGTVGFWMTGGLIEGNEAASYPAIKGDVTFSNLAQIQINAGGDKVSIDEALAGMATYSYIKPVMPDYEDYTTEVAITANVDPDNANVYYSTFYDSANKYALPAGVEAYVADLSGSDLVLTKIAGAGQVIPAGEAVILRASVKNFSLLLSFEAPVSVSTNNDLEGVDVATTLESLSINPANCYVLSGSDQYGVGFYRINANTLKAHKAYVIYNGNQNSAPKRMRFVFGTATGVEAVTGYGSQVTGKKVMIDGVLYIIKNGVRYNVQGQKVK